MTVTALESAAARGVLSTVGGQAARGVLQAAGLIVVTRFVSPADFGTVAMAAFVIGAAETVRDLGLGSAAAQTPELTDGQRDALFWLNSAGGALLAAAVALSAPLLAAFFHHDEVTAVTRALALVLLANGAAAQFRAELVRRLRFGRLARIELAAVAVSLVAGVGLAVRGAGVWAPVTQQVTFAVAGLAGLAGTAGWRPGRPRTAAGLRPVLRYGTHLMPANLLWYLSSTVDSLVIGRLFGAAALGGYDRAYQFLQVPLNQLNAPLSRVALPVLSRVREDRERFVALALRGQTLLVHWVGGALLSAAVLAQPGFALLLGPRWQGSVVLFQVLAVGGVFATAAQSCEWCLLSTGNAAAYLRCCLVTRPLLIGGLVAGAAGGVTGVACGYAAGTALGWPVALLFLRRATGLPVLLMGVRAVRVLARWAFAAGVAACVCAAVPAAPGWRLAAGVPVLLAAALLPAGLRRPSRRARGTPG